MRRRMRSPWMTRSRARCEPSSRVSSPASSSATAWPPFARRFGYGEQTAGHRCPHRRCGQASIAEWSLVPPTATSTLRGLAFSATGMRRVSTPAS